MRYRILPLLALALMNATITFADEGMWLPLHIKRLNYADMQKAGLELTAEEIYDINNSSLKDAIVLLNGGSCTAEMISAEGLMLTNHHCAYGVIQSSSTIEQNYLRDGFWAMQRSDEKYAEGMRASFLLRMDDVTDVVLEGISDDLSENERNKAISKVGDSLRKAAVGENKNYDATFKSMFNGNRFYIFLYETYKDVRLVAAPPEAIGKFGGDTDNWMWPRHTGDFSMLRIYADKDGRPAEFSPDNVPLKPKHHLPISLKGVKQEDFAMIMGFPGSTDRYLTSFGVRSEIATTHRARIKVRAERLAIYKADMDADASVRLKYASVYAGISNYYKNSLGMVKALNKLHVADLKSKEEAAFTNWLKENPDQGAKYGGALSMIQNSLEKMNDYQLARSYVIDALYYSQIVGAAWSFKAINDVLSAEELNNDRLEQLTKSMGARMNKFFKDYNMPTDKKAFTATLKLYYQDIPESFHPEYFNVLNKKYKGDFQKFADAVYKSTIFANEDRMTQFLANPSKKALEKDMAFQLAMSARDVYYNANGGDEMTQLNEDLLKGRRLYLAGLMEMQKDRKFYPDANSTMRLTYGNVLEYDPQDAVHYDYYTTLKGVVEKEDTSNMEFIVPAKLKELYQAKDYGIYGANDELVVNFITNNDITGGNSGSPVINGKGELIGCAFDGNWEALSGDIAFENTVQRTIVCDIRYILFIVDKYAGAGHLVKEMNLITN